jgi:hypothetical protein
MTQNKDIPCCGNCKFFVFGQRSYCAWVKTPKSKKVSVAYSSGGAGHAMWVDDGKGCETWKRYKVSKK